MLLGSVLHSHGIPYTDPAQMAVALGPIMGPVAEYGILLLMVKRGHPGRDGDFARQFLGLRRSGRVAS